RSAARDLLLANRVIASWSPKPKETTIGVESLSAGSPAARGAGSQVVTDLAPVRTNPFPPHSDRPYMQHKPERLASGVTVVGSSAFAIFVAPSLLEVFKDEPKFQAMQSYAEYAAGRILVMAPPDALDRMKQQWNLFLGNPVDSSQKPPAGTVSALD